MLDIQQKTKFIQIFQNPQQYRCPLQQPAWCNNFAVSLNTIISFVNANKSSIQIHIGSSILLHLQQENPTINCNKSMNKISYMKHKETGIKISERFLYGFYWLFQNIKKTIIKTKIISQQHIQIQQFKKLQQQWQELSQTFFNKDQLFLKYQYKSIQKIRKRQQWTQVEDNILKSCQQHIENTNWNQIAKEIYFRTNGQSYKSSKQCRQRWQNHLDNKIRKQGWQVSEDLTILEFVLENGKRWSKIVDKLQNTRTQHMVKNRFKSLLARNDGRRKQAGEKDGQSKAQVQLIKQIIKALRQRISQSIKTTRNQQIQQQNHQQKQYNQQQIHKQYKQKQQTIQSLQMQQQSVDFNNCQEQQQQQKEQIQKQQQKQQQNVKTSVKQQQQKRSHGMMILRGDSVEFVSNNNNRNNNNNNSNNNNINEQISIFIQSQTQQQPQYTFNIFECQSPATLSLASSGFLLSSSYSSFTPPSIAMGNNRNNLSFSSFHQHWQRNNINRLQQKGSISSDVGSNNTSRLIQCSRREDNLLFSLEFNNLLNNNNNNNNLLNNNNNNNNLLNNNNNNNINNNSNNNQPN